MQFLCSPRKWTSITRDAWLWMAIVAEHKVPDKKRRQINDQAKQYKSKPNKNTKNNLHSDNKT